MFEEDGLVKLKRLKFRKKISPLAIRDKIPIFINFKVAKPALFDWSLFQQCLGINLPMGG
ncbi:hypothetical protein [Lactobacillus sp. W8093]|uniref:hypothetical protein n=1 Tax=Lactobacillus sp. W8093 TaxID=2751038 RepID=UPI0018EFB284|nr:hypothetical protein [Lactobacillus sp. W8093]